MSGRLRPWVAWLVLGQIVLAAAIIIRLTLPPGYVTMRLTGRGDMIYVPAGPFTMGEKVNPNHLLNVASAHVVNLPGFYIDRHLVTNAQYAAFAAATGHRTPGQWVGGRYPAGQDRFPAYGLNMQDAEDYAAWAGKRLPSEAEWEKAARGTDGRPYPWGTGPAVFQINPLRPVGSQAGDASPYGVRDLITFGCEWTTTHFLPIHISDPVMEGTFTAKGFNTYARNAVHRNLVVLKTGEPVLLRCAADVPNGL